MSLRYGYIKAIKQEKRTSGADEGQGSTLRQPLYDRRMIIVKNYICDIKPPFQNTSSFLFKEFFRIPILGVVKVVYCRFSNPEKKRCT